MSGLVGVLAVVSVLCIGGGSAAYFFLTGEGPAKELPAAVQSPSAVVTESATPVAPTPSASPSAKPAAGGEEEVSGDLSGYKKGDCLTVDEAKDNRVEKAGCADPGAQKVLLRKGGTLDDSACLAVKASFSLSQDASGSTKDFVLCVGPAA